MMMWRKRQALIALLLLSASVASAARFNLKPWTTKTIKTGKQSTAPAEPSLSKAEDSSDSKDKADGDIVQGDGTEDIDSSDNSLDEESTGKDDAGGDKEVLTIVDDTNSTKSDHGDVKTFESSPGAPLFETIETPATFPLINC